MNKLKNKNNHFKCLPLALIGTAAALVSTGADATVISMTGLNQDVAPGTTLEDIGGMDGVDISWASNTAKLSSSSSDDSSFTDLISLGTVIGPTSTFSSDPFQAVNSGQNALLSGLFGVSFDAGSGIQYGWVDIQTIDNEPLAEVTLNGWGYETDVGVSIKAGPLRDATVVNAPAGLALLAAGAMGLVASRRRKVKPVLAA